LSPRLIPKPNAFAFGPASAGDQKAAIEGDVLTARGECPGERKAEPPPFRIGFAEIAPLSARGVLRGQSIQHDLAGWILSVPLDRINTDSASLTGAVAKYYLDTVQLILSEHAAVGQCNSKSGPLDHDGPNCCLRDRLR
jgi:hypothetical protein